MGRIRGGKLQMQAAQAVMAGLEHTWKQLSQEVNEGLNPSKPRTVIISTEYVPPLKPVQRSRWKIYGSRSQPAPDQQRLNEVLAKWTTSASVEALILRHSQEMTIALVEM